MSSRTKGHGRSTAGVHVAGRAHKLLPCMLLLVALPCLLTWRMLSLSLSRLVVMPWRFRKLLSSVLPTPPALHARVA